MRDLRIERSGDTDNVDSVERTTFDTDTTTDASDFRNVGTLLLLGYRDTFLSGTVNRAVNLTIMLEKGVLVTYF